MRRFKALTLVILILIVSAVIVTPVKSSSEFTLVKVYWGADQPIEVSPGDVATLTIVVRYEQSWSFSNLKAVLSLPNGFEAVGGDGVATIYYTRPISIGSIIELRFPLFITSNVDKGTYKASLDLEYYISQYVIPEENLEITFKVAGKPKIEASFVTDSLDEGRQQAYVYLINKGDGSAQNLKVNRIYMSGASIEVGSVSLLGVLNSGDKVIVPLTIYVPIGMEGRTLPLTVETECLGPTNVPYFFSDTLQIPVKPSSPAFLLSIDLKPREIVGGKSNEVYIDLVNTGNYTLSDIELTLTPDVSLKIFGSTTLYVETLNSKERKRFETEIYVPSATTVTTATLTATSKYVDSNLLITRSRSQQLSVLLRGLIEVSLTDLAVIPSAPVPGSPFSITMTVTNVGTTAAYAASAIPVSEGLPLRTFGPRSVFIGNIEANLPTTFTLNMRLGNTTAKEITLPVVLIYMDNLRSLHNVTFSVPIEIGVPTGSLPRPGQSGFEILGIPLSIFVIVIAVVAVTAVAVIMLRRRGKTE